MGKTLFWIAVFFGVLLASRFLAHHAAKKRSREEQARQTPRNNPLPSSEQMVRCAHCNVFLPHSEAVLSHDETWCSEAHAKLGPPHSH
jgi:uncharacterized protein